MSFPAASPDHPHFHGRLTGVALIGSVLGKVAPGPARLFSRHVHPHVTPFNLTVAAVIGAVTTVFVVLILLVILVATNFNLLGAIE